MPPASSPVPEQILSALEARLALPDGGADYFFDINVVKVGQDIFQASIFPAATIGIGEIGAIRDPKEGRVLLAGNFHWQMSIFAAIDGYVDAPRRLLRLFHDIHRALMLDRTLGGLVMNTTILGCEMLPPATEDDTRAWVEIPIEVHFRTREASILTGV
jgi:hypothetical protein